MLIRKSIFAATLLAGAFVFQALGYAPCKMCIWQRWPHGFAIGAGALVLLAGPLALLAVVGAASAALTGAIGVYHTGVERGWWQGPDTCTSGSVSDLTPQELLEQIMAAPLARCDEVPWELFSLSMASWNAIISVGLALLWIAASRVAD